MKKDRFLFFKAAFCVCLTVAFYPHELVFAQEKNISSNKIFSKADEYSKAIIYWAESIIGKKKTGQKVLGDEDLGGGGDWFGEGIGSLDYGSNNDWNLGGDNGSSENNDNKRDNDPWSENNGNSQEKSGETKNEWTQYAADNTTATDAEFVTNEAERLNKGENSLDSETGKWVSEGLKAEDKKNDDFVFWSEKYPALVPFVEGTEKLVEKVSPESADDVTAGLNSYLNKKANEKESGDWKIGLWPERDDANPYSSGRNGSQDMEGETGKGGFHNSIDSWGIFLERKF